MAAPDVPNGIYRPFPPELEARVPIPKAMTAIMTVRVRCGICPKKRRNIVVSMRKAISLAPA
jgi:hypothetical protein